MADECEVRAYSPGDEEGIVSLLRLALPGWPGLNLDTTPLEHWRLKHLDNPLGHSLINVGVHNGKIVGCTHAILSRFKVGDKILSVGNGLDVAVHPDFRGKGIFNEMNETRIDTLREMGADLALWSSSNPILVKKWHEIGNEFPHAITNYCKIQDIDTQLSAMPVKNPWTTRAGFLTLKTINSISNIFLPRKTSESKTSISDSNSFDNRVNDLWERTSSHYDYIQVRDSDYLNWRYCDPRSGSFLIRQAQEGEQILGYAVMSVNSTLNGYPVGFIVDLLTRPSREDIAEALVSDAVAFFEGAGVNLVSCLALKDHPLGKMLNRHGFLNSRMRFHLFYSVLNRDVNVHKETVRKAHFMFGDRDSLPTSVPQH